MNPGFKTLKVNLIPHNIDFYTKPIFTIFLNKHQPNKEIPNHPQMTLCYGITNF